jgi:LETM1 and EF-hand domain-containing protein 1
VRDLKKALAVIKHKPDEEVGEAVIQKLDVDKDGFVELEHVLGLVREEGLGTTAVHRIFARISDTEMCLTGVVIDGEAQDIIGQGHEIKNSKPRKEDIVQE